MSDRPADAPKQNTPPPLQQQPKMRPRSPAEALEPTRAPARPRGHKVRRTSPRMRGLVKFVSGLLTTVLVLMAFAGGLIGYVSYQFDQPGPLEATRTFVIPKGDGRLKIAEQLEKDGIISNRFTFILGHLVKSVGANAKAMDLKAGEYEIKKHASVREVLDTLATGRSVLQKITVPEGLTSHQIVERLKLDQNLSGEIAEVPPEGAMLPETYRFSKGMTRAELVERMRADQQRLLAQLWEKRQPDLPFKTMEEALIMASIVEKETGRSDEREKVAAVFVNRLRKGMPLQSDPTILYGLYKGQVQWGKPILRSEIESKTEHNTYQIKALPPTPICNPGRPAIEATLNPAKTQDLYFVADGSGGHIFSQTLKDHNAAVANWRKVEKDMRAKQQEAAPAGQTTRAAIRTGPGAVPAGSAPAPAGEPPAAAQDAPAAPAPPAAEQAPASAAANAAGVPLPARKPKR